MRHSIDRTATNGRGRRAAVALVAVALVGAACSGDDADDAASTTTDAPVVAAGAADRSYYVLPPGNFGGIPTDEHSLDQLPLYDGLTPLRDEVTDADIDEHFLPQDLAPVGPTTEEPTGRDGVEILYDSFGIPHVTGETRADMAFGAGWVTARDRGLLLDFGLDATRAAVADVPGIDAFELVLELRDYQPSEQADALLDDQMDLLVDELGPEGEEIIADATAFADGGNAYWAANDIDHEPVSAKDVIAATAFIGSIFGAGGGSEASNAELLAQLQAGLGDERGTQAWEDVMLMGDPEAPTTLEETFDYGVRTGGDVTGSVAIDAGSVESFDPMEDAGGGAGTFGYPAAGPPPDRQASNWLLVDPAASADGTSMGVLGPQLGYYYPEIVQQIHLRAPGIDAQGAAVVGLGMYILIGRTADYAWSLTSASHDVRDVFAEVLCEPDGSEPTRESDHYEVDGECRPFEVFDAGTLDGVPLVFDQSVHGPVIGTATSEGRPVALTRQRSTYGRDAINLLALKHMTEGRASTVEGFYETANEFEFTFNWGWVGREGIAFFSSGRLPVRAEGLDRRLPTSGTGEYEWTGFLDQDEHPHGTAPASGRLLNWNNQSAPGFMHGDGTSYGSVHRVETFDQWPEPVDLAGVVGVMNRSATEFPDSLIWPTVSEVLAGSEAPTPLARAVVDELDAWVADDAPALDADDDGTFDQAGPTIAEALWEPLVMTAIEPVFGDQAELVYEERSLGSDDGASILDKDLRTLLGEDVEGPFNLQYCGAGSLERCRDELWATLDRVSGELAAEYGNDDPSTWLMEGWRTGFAPDLIPETIRTVNRPTFQQLIELVPGGGS